MPDTDPEVTGARGSERAGEVVQGVSGRQLVTTGNRSNYVSSNENELSSIPTKNDNIWSL